MMLKQTKIVASISDERCEVEFIRDLFKAGMNVVRMNTAHASREGFEKLIRNVREVSNRIAILMDTKGPEVRTTAITGGEPIPYKIGDRVKIVGNPNQETTRECIAVSYPGFVHDLQVDGDILIDDGDLELRVVDKTDEYLVCEVQNEATLGNRKSVNVPGVRINLPSLTEKDRNNILYAIEKDIDYIAHSFVRNKQDVLDIRQILDTYGSDIKIIAKIENQEGVDNFDEILAASDGIMVARGDLSVEIPMARVPAIQKEFIRKTYLQGKIVITATQMLESMIHNPRPTRAEVSDISNAMYDATSAVMLSGESATGKYPVECVELMDAIAQETEGSINYWKRFQTRDYDLAHKGYRFNVYHGICVSAMNLDAKAIIAYTESGDTPGILSAFCPTCPIYAITRNEKLVRQLNLEFNVYPRHITEDMSIDDMIQSVIEKLEAEGKVEKGDTIIIAGGAEVLPNLKGAKTNKVIGGIVQL